MRPISRRLHQALTKIRTIRLRFILLLFALLTLIRLDVDLLTIMKMATIVIDQQNRTSTAVIFQQSSLITLLQYSEDMRRPITPAPRGALENYEF